MPRIESLSDLLQKEYIMDNYLAALELTYKAEIATALANLDNLLNNSVGVADHPDLIKSLDECIASIASSQDKLSVLQDTLE
tara:strand:+ start:2307 stop:2552 length:246 start_codon:yes stop_codon:yes gene_type:complete